MIKSMSLAMLVCLMPCSVFAQSAPVDAAALELTAPVEIAQVRLWRIGNEGFSQQSSTAQLANLSRKQVADLLSAKTVVVAFLKALESDDGNPFPLMTADFARQHPDKVSLYQSVIGQETTLLELAITGFAWSRQDDDALTLFFTPIVFSEGDLSVGKAQANLKRAGTEWRIADLKPDETGSGFLVEQHSSIK
jgi:hypothetical protein